MGGYLYRERWGNLGARTALDLGIRDGNPPTTQHTSKSTEIYDFSDITCSQNPGLCFVEVCEAPQARCSGEQSYFSDMTCSENPGPVFAEVCEAPQARCSGEQSLEYQI